MAFDYDKQIARLTEHPEYIKEEWFSGTGLFAVMAEATDLIYAQNDALTCGCLTQIRCLKNKVAFVNGAVDKDLTRAIKRDKRLPKDVNNIRPGHLPVFKEWQQLMDTLRRQ